jgi:hypothetical protein
MPIPIMEPLKKTRGIAYFNHGRWLADCPVCGSPIGVSPEKADLAVCPICSPGLFASKQVEVPLSDEDKLLEPTATKAFRTIPDGEARRAVFELARKHHILFPDDWKKIEDMLRMRETRFMNWLPGETLDMLKAENIEHQVMEI